MTTQTQPEPAQVWRDLDDINQWQVGDRIVSYCGHDQLQRPVTPGQCDCAGLREALEQAQILCAEVGTESTDFRDTVNQVYHILSKALSQPCTCAGKIGCSECGSTDDKHVPSCSKVLSQTSEGRTEQTCAGKSAEEWTCARLYPIFKKQGLRGLADLINAELTEARRKLAEAESVIMRAEGLARVHRITHPAKDLDLIVSACESYQHSKGGDAVAAPTWRSYATGPKQDGVARIAAERQRQIQKEGFDDKHDTEHTDEPIALAAVCYAMPWSRRKEGEIPQLWQWSDEDWKPCGNRIRELEKAGALIAAEIDRILRALPKLPPEPRQDADEAWTTDLKARIQQAWDNSDDQAIGDILFRDVPKLIEINQMSTTEAINHGIDSIALSCQTPKEFRATQDYAKSVAKAALDFARKQERK